MINSEGKSFGIIETLVALETIWLVIKYAWKLVVMFAVTLWTAIANISIDAYANVCTGVENFWSLIINLF